MKVMSDEQMLQSIDWKAAVPLVLELVKEGLKPTKDWERIFQIGIDLVKVLMQAEQATGMSIDWAKLIQLILTIISMFGQTEANSGWKSWLEWLLSMFFPSPDKPIVPTPTTTITTTPPPGNGPVPFPPEFGPLP